MKESTGLLPSLSIPLSPQYNKVVEVEGTFIFFKFIYLITK
jgi:hypothetical protein